MGKVKFASSIKLDNVFDEIPMRSDDGQIIYFRPHQKENGEWTLIGYETSSVNED